MKKSSKHAIEAGLGAAALAATAAAAAYFLTGKDGAKNRKKLGAWATKAKKEVAKEVKNMKSYSQGSYDKTVDAVLKNYKNLKNLDSSEVLALGKELKGHWESIQSEVKKTLAKRSSVGKKPAAKAKPKTKK